MKGVQLTLGIGPAPYSTNGPEEIRNVGPAPTMLASGSQPAEQASAKERLVLLGLFFLSYAVVLAAGLSATF